MSSTPESSRRALFVGWLALLLASVASCAQPPDLTGRPNVLFIFADDQRADTIAALGNPMIRTPTLDRLVAEGFRFSRTYCMGSPHGAVCVPSRAMLHTGRSLFRAPRDMLGVPTIGELAREIGYATFATGKWHNGAEGFRKSFERGKNVLFGGMADHTRVPLRDLADDEFSDERIGDAFSTTLFVDAAVEFLQQHDGERPFFAYVALTAPHDPRDAPPEYLAMYEPDDMPLPPAYMPIHPLDNGWLVGRDENLAGWPRTEEVIRAQTAEYFALISHMDHEIGRLLAALDESGMREDTIIVYAADHGLSLGNHGLLGKQSLYEHSMRAPLMILGDGVPRGEATDELVYLFDLFPTLCDWLGIEPPGDIDGRSLRPIWKGGEYEARDRIFTAFGHSMRALRDDRWKVIRYPKINRTQLFDLASDPHELHNLADDPAHEAELVRLANLMHETRIEFGDGLPLETDQPFPETRDLSDVEREPDQWQPEWIVEKYFRDQ